ncbi:MAG: hypothetical protein KDJ62_05655 [Rhodobiaceae bacterium]|nr:hypothetical protein [Rhodobiaceae bacterium]MCC0048004.1 hypothetical protein [Rhodobiaceae bacterium]
MGLHSRYTGAANIINSGGLAVLGAALLAAVPTDAANARGREQSIADVPVSVTAVDTEMLSRRGIMDVPDVVFIPGTNGQTAVPARFLRGSPNAQATSFQDYGGGSDFSAMLFNLDPVYGHGGYQSGVFTSSLQPYAFQFEGGEILIKFHGQSNSGLVSYDNGNPVRDDTFIGTNPATPSYVGMSAGGVLDSGVYFGANLSASFAFNKWDVQRDDDDLDAGCDYEKLDRNVCLQKAELFIGTRELGKVYLGLGETAYAGLHSMTLGPIAHVTNSDPNLRAGEHEVFGFGSNYALFTPDVTGVQEASRVKYVSPTIAGFMLSASAGEPDHVGAGFDVGDDYWDIALRYAGEFGAFRVAAGIGYQDFDRNQSSYSQQNLTGTASLMHVPSGVFVTFNYTNSNRDAPMALGATDVDSADSFYAHAGITQKWFSIGQTTIYGEYGVTDDGESSGAFYTRGSEQTNFGVGLVQNFDRYGVSAYLTYNNIGAERNGAKAEDIDIITAGWRTKY